MEPRTLSRLADLAVGFGANVQPDQILVVIAQTGNEPLARAVAASAYGAGARHVDMVYEDPWVRRARIEHGSDASIGFAPSWKIDRVRALGEQRVAYMRLEGGVDPAATDGLDQERLGNDQSPERREHLRLVAERLLNWTLIPSPNESWARIVYPDLEPGAAHAKLWEEIVTICRLDFEDPVAAWNARMDRLREVAGHLNERRLDAVHFRGPGTDLTVGLLPSSRWLAAGFTTAEGIPHHPNVPSEEVFTGPDPARVDGVVRSTKPLEVDGTVITGLKVRFEGGRAVEIDADTGRDLLRTRVAMDEGGSRLGEVALVDGEGRIGALGTVFFTTLIDENAASHIALGNAYPFTYGDPADQERANHSRNHIDFMIGSPEVDVDGTTVDGERLPLLRGGDWQF